MMMSLLVIALQMMNIFSRMDHPHALRTSAAGQIAKTVYSDRQSLRYTVHVNRINVRKVGGLLKFHRVP